MATTFIENLSDTALWVAAHRMMESEKQDALFQDPLAAKLSGERGRAIAFAMPYFAMTAWLIAMRTVTIDQLILEAMAEGVDTVINIGAGLDTRPYRLNVSKALRWIEIDFPNMIQFKNERLVNETPKCRLERIGLDLSDRTEATRLYSALGEQSEKALLLTEGVVPYLTEEQAGNLAHDLRSITAFQFWIQDYRTSGIGLRHPQKLKRKLLKAPFRFDHPDPLSFFSAHGWQVKSIILAIDQGERLGRRVPMPFLRNLFLRLIPTRWDLFRKSLGYVLLRPSELKVISS